MAQQSSQTIYVTGITFQPGIGYRVTFSADPTPVPFGSSAVITYKFKNVSGYSFVGANLQRSPATSNDELTWWVPADGNSIVFNDINSDAAATLFGVELIFRSKSGDRFSSADPEIENEGNIPP